MSTKKDHQRTIREAEARGWIVDRTRSSHVRLRLPGTNVTVVCSGSPGKGRAHQNFVADLRRAERLLTDSSTEGTMAR